MDPRKMSIQREHVHSLGMLFFLCLLCFLPAYVLSEGEEGVVNGHVSGHFHRPIKPSNNPTLEKMLARYGEKPTTFATKTKLLQEGDAYDLFEVRFPSPYRSRHSENNVVWCEYYRSKKEGLLPAVIVLHVLDGKFIAARIICDYLARIGCHSLMLKMPYYGERRPKEADIKGVITSDPDITMRALYQTVLDVRRSASFLAAQKEVDKEKIGLCGISLGAFATGLVAGIDGTFPKSAMILGGGDFAGMVMHGPKEIQEIAEQMKKAGYTYESLKKKFVFISPMTYAHRIPPGSLLMINGTQDSVVPPDNAKAFWQATKGQPAIIWSECSHYTAVLHIIDFMETVGAFFVEKPWT